jgi:hypothetical protein
MYIYVAWIPIWAFGRKFEQGKSSERLPEQSLGILMGMFGSAFVASLAHFYQEIRMLLPTSAMEKADAMVTSFSKDADVLMYSLKSLIMVVLHCSVLISQFKILKTSMNSCGVPSFRQLDKTVLWSPSSKPFTCLIIPFTLINSPIHRHLYVIYSNISAQIDLFITNYLIACSIHTKPQNSANCLITKKSALS